jgi:hypothetical protein
MIRLLQDYRGVITNEALLEAGDYETLSDELLNRLLEKGYAIRLDGEQQAPQEESEAEAQETRSEPVSQVEVIEEFVAKSNAPKPKTKPKG